MQLEKHISSNMQGQHTTHAIPINSQGSCWRPHLIFSFDAPLDKRGGFLYIITTSPGHCHLKNQRRTSNELLQNANWETEVKLTYLIPGLPLSKAWIKRCLRIGKYYGVRNCHHLWLHKQSIWWGNQNTGKFDKRTTERSSCMEQDRGRMQFL